MLGVEAFEMGRIVGMWLAPPFLAAVVVAAWGAWRADADRLRSGLRFAWHWRTLSVAGLLWGASMLGGA
jgi:hypothetical protein